MNDDHSTQGAFVRDVKYAGMSVIALVALIATKSVVLSSSMQSAQVISSSPYYQLVDAFSFDEGEGSVAHDSKNGRGIDLSYTGWDSGVHGLSASFDGVSSWAVMNGFNLNGTPGSIALWMDLVPGAAMSTVISGPEQFDSVISGFSVTLNDPICGTGEIAFRVKGNVGYNSKCYAFPGSGWHHYAFIIDKAQNAQNELTLYIDGAVATPVSTPEQSDNRTYLSNYPVYFMSHGGTTSFTAGKIDELYIFNGALTTKEVMNLYQNSPSDDGAVLPTQISAITVSNIAADSATISWVTDKVAQDDSIEYGLTASYGQSTDTSTSPGSALHTRKLTGLQPGTTYHFRISEEFGDSVSDDHTFVTSGAPSTGGSNVTITSSGQVTYTGSGTVTTPSGQIQWPVAVDNGQQSTTTIPSYFNDPLTNMVRAIDPHNDGSLIRSNRMPRTATILTPYNVDATAPTIPQNLRASFVDAHHIDLDWDASTDNIAVTGYRLYRDGELLATTEGTHYSDVLDIPQSSYVYTVAAFDATDNVSPQSIAEVAVLPDDSLTFYQRLQIALARVRQFWDRFIYITGYRINILLNGGQ